MNTEEMYSESLQDLTDGFWHQQHTHTYTSRYNICIHISTCNISHADAHIRKYIGCICVDGLYVSCTSCDHRCWVIGSA